MNAADRANPADGKCGKAGMTEAEVSETAHEDSGSEKRIRELMEQMASDPRVLQMKKFIQHGNVTSYDHVFRVARESLKVARRLHLKVDEESLIRSAILHDYYLYDWHGHGDHLHGYHHPYIAADNAARDFDLTQKELKSIETHMWPLNIKDPPTSNEALAICIADKICSIQETLHMRKHRK